MVDKNLAPNEARTGLIRLIAKIQSSPERLLWARSDTPSKLKISEGFTLPTNPENSREETQSTQKFRGRAETSSADSSSAPAGQQGCGCRWGPSGAVLQGPGDPGDPEP